MSPGRWTARGTVSRTTRWSAFRSQQGSSRCTGAVTHATEGDCPPQTTRRSPPRLASLEPPPPRLPPLLPLVPPLLSASPSRPTFSLLPNLAPGSVSAEQPVTAQPFLASLLSSPLRLPKLQRPAFLSASLAVTVSGSVELTEADWSELGARGGCHPTHSEVGWAAARRARKQAFHRATQPTTSRTDRHTQSEVSWATETEPRGKETTTTSGG